MVFLQNPIANSQYYPYDTPGGSPPRYHTLMADRPICPLCNTRKPKRPCPALSADICPQCCGREREETIRCPLDCPYLLEGRKHDRPGPEHVLDFPHKDIRVEEEYIEQIHELFTVVSLSIVKAAQETPGILDSDIRDCLEAVIKTYRTQDSGLIYETKPANTVAAAMQTRLTESIEEFKKFAFEKTGVHSVKDADLLKILVFLQRLEITSNNGRRYGRAFYSSMRNAFDVQAPDAVTLAPESTSSLII